MYFRLIRRVTSATTSLPHFICGFPRFSGRSMLESLDCRGFVCVVSVFTGLSPWESGVALGSDKMNKKLNAEKSFSPQQHEGRERFEIYLSFVILAVSFENCG